MAGAAVPTPRFLADVYEAASECNKCSLCQATCPAYVVNPVEWETARGRIALIRDAMEGRLELRDIADGPLSTCLTCDNCVAACAPRVPTGHIVSRARQELHAQEGYPWAQSFALRSVLPRPGALRALHGVRAIHPAHRAVRAGAPYRAAVVARHCSARSPSRAAPRPIAPSTRCSVTCRRPRSRCAATSRCSSAASRISPRPRPPTQPSGCCSPPATPSRCRSSAAAVCRRARSATATPWSRWRSRTALR